MRVQCVCNVYVKVDVWDGDSERGPVVTHGHALCSKIYLADVLQTILDSYLEHEQYATSFPIRYSLLNISPRFSPLLPSSLASVSVFSL